MNLGRPFTQIKLCTTGTRWFYYYRYTTDGGERKLIKRYGGVNRIKNKRERKRVLQAMAQAEWELLLSGWSPVDKKLDDIDILLKNNLDAPLLKVLKLALAEKAKTLKENKTWREYRRFLTHFESFLEKERMQDVTAPDLKKTDIKNWLHSFGDVSNRYKRNALSALITLSGEALENEWIKANPFAMVKKTNFISEPKKHKVFSPRLVNEIAVWCRENDPYLLTYLKVIGYTFFRPKEIQGLKIIDIDLESRLIFKDRTKQNRLQVKRIFDQLLPDLQAMQLHRYANYWHVFGHESPQKIRVGESYFQRKFDRCRKALGLGHEYTAYGIRHTFISDLRKNGVSDSDCMAITGHTTIAAFQKYLRDINADLPNDVSGDFTLKL